MFFNDGQIDCHVGKRGWSKCIFTNRSFCTTLIHGLMMSWELDCPLKSLFVPWIMKMMIITLPTDADQLLMSFYFFISKMLSHPSIQISYFAAGIVSHLACLPGDVWMSALQYNKGDFVRVLVSFWSSQAQFGNLFCFREISLSSISVSRYSKPRNQLWKLNCLQLREMVTILDWRKLMASESRRIGELKHLFRFKSLLHHLA